MHLPSQCLEVGLRMEGWSSTWIMQRHLGKRVREEGKGGNGREGGREERQIHEMNGSNKSNCIDSYTR